MKKKASVVILGVCFILAGISIAGNVLNWWNLTLFIKGWWTLFIIIPFTVNLIFNGISGGSLIGASIGIMLLMAERNVIGYSTIMMVLLPAILILAGISLLFRSIFPYNDKSSSGEKAFRYTVSLIISIICLLALSFVLVYTDNRSEYFAENRQKNYYDFYEEYNDIINMQIDIDNTKLDIIQGDVFSVQAYNINSALEVYVDGNTLYIEEGNIFDIFDYFTFVFEDNYSKDTAIIITIPKDTSLNVVSIHGGSKEIYTEGIYANEISGEFGSGKASIINCNAEKAYISSGSGSCYLENVKFKKAKIESSSGMVNITFGEINNLDLNSGSGMFYYEGRLTGKCSVDSGSGNVVFAIDGDIENYYVSGRTGSGGIWINGIKKDSFNMGLKDNENSIKIDGGSGRVTVEISKNIS